MPEMSPDPADPGATSARRGGRAASGRRTGAAGNARPTSKDVARAAGVSQATVSLVLGGAWPGRVSARTAAAVQEAARSLGYRPNLAARNLRLGRSRTALLVVPPLTSEFFGLVHSGAARVAAEHGVSLLLRSAPSTAEAESDPLGGSQGSPDGLIVSSMTTMASALIGATGTDDLDSGRSWTAQAAAIGPERSLPLVLLDGAPILASAGPVATVNYAAREGMHQVVRHLTSLGHRRITHLAADTAAWTFTRTARAFAESLATGTPAYGYTERAPLSVAGGRQAAERALTHPRHRPTALICDDDVLAAGAIKAIRRLGLRIPADVSVTGFGDLALASAVDPALTTIRLHAEELGERAMLALLSLLDERPVDQTDLPVRLIVRASTAPPPG